MFTTLIATALVISTPWPGLFTQADVLNLRQQPSAAAPVVARLRINTRLKVLESRPEWMRVVVAGRPEANEVGGWVPMSFLDNQMIKPLDARVRAQDARDLWERRRWAERAVAADGTADANWDLLEQTLEELDDQRVLRDVRDARAGRHDVYLAVCTGQRVLLAGWLQPGDGFMSAGGLDAKQRAAVMKRLDGVAWFQHHGQGGVQTVAGTPFVRPFETPSTNENAGDGYTPGTCEAICDEGRNIVLGPCAGPGSVFATSPMQTVGVEPLVAGELSKVVTTAVQSLGDRKVSAVAAKQVAGTDMRQVEVTAVIDGHYEPQQNNSWMVLDSAGSPLVVYGPLWPQPTATTTYGSYTNARWFRLRVNGVDHHLVLHDMGYEMGAGYSATLIGEDGQVESMFSHMHTWGC